MDAQQIEAILREALDVEEVQAKTDGSHAHVIVVSEAFTDLSRLKREQMVNKPLNAAISDGSIHALTIKTYTPEQWRRDKLLQSSQ